MAEDDVTPELALLAGLTSDDLRLSLTTLRDVLATELVLTRDPKAKAALAKQFADVAKAIDALPGEEASKTDELAERRAARRAQVSKRAAGDDVGGPGGG